MSIAGIDSAVAAMRELVLWPVTHADVVKLSAPAAVSHGVLLHGPPGVGKTAVTRAVVAEARRYCDVHFAVIDGPEVRGASSMC